MENYNIWWSPIGLGTSLCSLPAKNLLIEIQLGWSLSDNLFSIRNDQETNEFAPFLKSTKTDISHCCSLLVDNGVLWKGVLWKCYPLRDASGGKAAFTLADSQWRWMWMISFNWGDPISDYKAGLMEVLSLERCIRCRDDIFFHYLVAWCWAFRVVYTRLH